MARPKTPTKKLTYKEFLAWCDEDTRAEWVNGEVIVLAPPSTRHQKIFGFLSSILGIYAQVHDLGTVLTAPFQMHLTVLNRGREPDLLFIKKEHQQLLKETHLEGPADLVVEIISPESRLRDRGEKFAEYEQGGVEEYWIIDPEQERADFYQLGKKERYRMVEPDEKGIYHSQVLSGFWLKVEWLWQDPLPPVLQILRELDLV